MKKKRKKFEIFKKIPKHESGKSKNKKVDNLYLVMHEERHKEKHEAFKIGIGWRRGFVGCSDVMLWEVQFESVGI